MRLKTSHGTYVVFGPQGELQHGSGPLDLDFSSTSVEVLSSRGAGGVVELTVTKGPLAPSTLVLLQNGLVAFRRNSLYLCAEAALSELLFDRTEVGPWEQFEIEAHDATAASAALRDAMADVSWIDLRPVPNSLKPARSERAEDFDRAASANFVVREEEYIYAPITIRYEHLKLFQNGVKVHFPTELAKPYSSALSMLKGPSKYINLSENASGVIFDSDGFWTDPGFFRIGAAPEYVSLVGDVYYLDRKVVDELDECDGQIVVFHDGNYRNYYHWWAECLVNIEVAEICLGYIPPFYILGDKPNLSNWQIASLEILGVQIIYKEGTNFPLIRAKEAIWFNRDTSYVPGVILRSLRARALKTLPMPAVSERKIYIKRKNNRGVKNDLELEGMLSDLGFEIIFAEEYTQIDQIKIFRSAKILIGVHGAGLTNMLFMPEGSSVIELTPSVEIRTFFWLMAEKLRHKYGVLVCDSVDDRFDGLIDVDLADLRRLIAALELHAGFAAQRSATVSR